MKVNHGAQTSFAVEELFLHYCKALNDPIRVRVHEHSPDGCCPVAASSRSPYCSDGSGVPVAYLVNWVQITHHLVAGGCARRAANKCAPSMKPTGTGSQTFSSPEEREIERNEELENQSPLRLWLIRFAGVPQVVVAVYLVVTHIAGG